MQRSPLGKISCIAQTLLLQKKKASKTSRRLSDNPINSPNKSEIKKRTRFSVDEDKLTESSGSSKKAKKTHREIDQVDPNANSHPELDENGSSKSANKKNLIKSSNRDLNKITKDDSNEITREDSNDRQEEYSCDNSDSDVCQEEKLETENGKSDQKENSKNLNSPFKDASDSHGTTPLANSKVEHNFFENLEIRNEIKDSLKKIGYTRMTPIQEQTIPSLLCGKDVLGVAKTGSGKTLAFLIPAIEILLTGNFERISGSGVIILAPTRELVLQIYGVALELLENTKINVGMVIGGYSRQKEVKKLSVGINLLIATPGRLLDHIQHTQEFYYKNLKCLIIDECDKILDVGFEEELRQIIKALPKNRQTMLFSATRTPKIQDIGLVSLRKNAVIIDLNKNEPISTVEGLEQGYIVCKSNERFLLLFNFLKRNLKKKIIVFFSSCNVVKYYAALLNYIEIPVLELHGQLKQSKRTKTFFTFCNSKSGILLSTDVAARGLDIPQVDWIVQYDPPDDPREYIHRVGRTARGIDGRGKALLILLPSEVGFLKYLKQKKIFLKEYQVSEMKDIQGELEKLIEKNYYLNNVARVAYRSYLYSYSSHSLKEIFNISSLDLVAIAKSFGFPVPPKVHCPGAVQTKKA